MMKIISIDKENIDAEHICCAIGNDLKNKTRTESKKQWMKDRFDDGLVFKRLDERGKVFIEYMPIEKVWKPIVGKNFMVIHCLWVSGQFKGKGLSTQLLNECISDTKQKKMDGIAVVTSNQVKPFLTDKKFYLKHGFELVDTAAPYFELLVLKLNKKAKNPSFIHQTKTNIHSLKKGFTFIYSNQCPFMDEYVAILANLSKKHKIPVEIKKLKNHKEAQDLGSPFGTLGIYFDGTFLTHELMTEKKFETLIVGLGL
ncbi:GNAT family N-acetyltransferase [Leptospira vanthielii]|uniref:Acetyltransferase, GNAT family n=1 Tax=Leptospira vanthielii serovar Holland str. Waz Holland = ATCC 700522 TaxID=1218591 RepID=N1W498_9LEPT|nr:GNAT family N-acetyltransferase [Leptospira vanthielii]EMY68295.1 acetyltransferase, GNAT family [Leptospira vanthielii serovar Holland str. Waz Holland = ATCC 700522]